MNEKILTRNPDPSKRGVKIDKDRYDVLRKTILTILKEQGPLTTKGLVEAVVDVIEKDGKVDYSVGWAAMAVKLDLDAKGEITYDRAAKPAVHRLP